MIMEVKAMKYLSRITAVLFSAVIGCSAAGVTCMGGSEPVIQYGSLILSDIDSGVYSVTLGKTKIFTLKMSDVSKIGAVSSDKSVAKITALSYKNSTVRVTVKGVSEGTAVIKVYDRNDKKKAKSITVSVSEEPAPAKTQSAEDTSSDEMHTITVGTITIGISGVKKDPEAVKNEVLELINAEREKCGAAPLALNDDLAAAAQIRADECARVYSHTRPDGRSCFTVLSDNNITYSCAGENIAYGYTSAEAVVNGWMASPPHKANLLSEKYTETGIGYDPATNSWTQIFIG
ncbi:MAG: CAP domain-containing protein [Oscillospiraceae bacterium]